MDLYLQLLLDKFVYMIIIFGALNWGFIGLFKINLVNPLLNLFSFNYGLLNRSIYSIIGFAALLKLMNRNYYLPFLGKTVYPCDTLKKKTPVKATIATKIKTTPNSNVIYWASEGKNDIIIRNPIQAYNKMSNSGVTLSDDKGIAILKVRQPVAYKVPLKFTIKPHVHYRVCIGNGMLSEVRTVFLK